MGGHHVAGPGEESGFPYPPTFNPTLFRLVGGLDRLAAQARGTVSSQKTERNPRFLFLWVAG